MRDIYGINLEVYSDNMHENGLRSQLHALIVHHTFEHINQMGIKIYTFYYTLLN